jgi:hypothetical protein
MAKQALILTIGRTLVDWSEDHDYSQDPSSIYRPADHTIITTAFTSLPGNWKNFTWIWNSGRSEFDNTDDIESNTSFNPHPPTDHCGCGEIDIETVDVNTNGFGNAMHLDTDGNWIDAKGDMAATMPCMAVALESGTGQKKLLKKGFIRDDSWNWTVGAWVYVSYLLAGQFTQDEADTTGQKQQKIGFAYRSKIIFFDPSKTILTRK